MKIKLIQYYTSNCEQGAASEKINRLYCEKYDIDYFILNDDGYINFYNEKRHINWYKIKFTKDILQYNDHDYVIFVDADVYFTNQNKDIRDIINLYLDKDLIITYDWRGENLVTKDSVNTGVMIFKNTPWSIDFLKRIWEGGNTVARGTYLNDYALEQTIVSIFLTVNIEDIEKTQLLDPYIIDSINDLFNRPETLIFNNYNKVSEEKIENSINDQLYLKKIRGSRYRFKHKELAKFKNQL